MARSATISPEKQHSIMTKTPIPRLVCSMAVPTVASQLVSVLYNTADTWFVSQISTSASAAVGVAFSIMSVIQALGFGISMGMSSLISRLLGEKKNEEAQTYAMSAFFAAITLGTLLGAIGLIFIDPLLSVLGSTETMLPHAKSYATYILAGAPIMCSSFVLSNVLRAQGRAKIATLGLASGNILNILLDPLLIFAFDMGVGGAALATVISLGVSFLVLLILILSGKSILKLKLSFISKSPRVYGKIFMTGLPTIFRQSLASVASATLNVQARAFGGDAAVSAFTIANKAYLLVRQVVMGIGQGFQPVAGYNFGAKNKRRTREAFNFTTILGTAVCVIGAAFMLAFPESIIGWFRDDPAVIEIGALALRFLALVLPFMAYSTYVNQLYQCLGFKLWATVLASCRQGIFFLPLIYALSHTLGLLGVQMTQPAADLLTFIASIPFHIYFLRKHLTEKKA